VCVWGGGVCVRMRGAWCIVLGRKGVTNRNRGHQLGGIWRGSLTSGGLLLLLLTPPLLLLLLLLLSGRLVSEMRGGVTTSSDPKSITAQQATRLHQLLHEVGGRGPSCLFVQIELGAAASVWWGGGCMCVDR
jgi:hypothetical protein